MSDFDIHTVLPKTLVEALTLLANDAQVVRFARELEELVSEEGNEIDEAEAIEHDAYDPAQWGTGVEMYEQMSEDQLWEALGRGAEKTVPFFNTEQFVTGAYDPWTEEGAKEMARGVGLAPLAPMRHQLVGIYAMLAHAFEGLPTLLMDGVGVGKTMQVVGFICFLTWFQQYYAKNRRFPGAFSTWLKPLSVQSYSPMAQEIVNSTAQTSRIGHISSSSRSPWRSNSSPKFIATSNATPSISFPIRRRSGGDTRPRSGAR